MRRLVYAIVLGLVGAGIVHIVILILLPRFTERDAWTRLAARAEIYSAIRIDPAGGSGAFAASVDPLFFAVACRFDLAEGMARMHAPGRVPFWSVSVYDRGGQNINSFNDRIAEDARLDFVVLDAAQMIEVGKALPEGLQGSIFVETEIREGIIVLRTFVPDQTWAPAIARFLDAVKCEPI